MLVGSRGTSRVGTRGKPLEYLGYLKNSEHYRMKNNYFQSKLDANQIDPVVQIPRTPSHFDDSGDLWAVMYIRLGYL